MERFEKRFKKQDQIVRAPRRFFFLKHFIGYQKITFDKKKYPEKGKLILVEQFI
jgi:hypothetical protein